MRSFCRKNRVRKIPLFWGGFWGGGGSADFIFMGARIFLIIGQDFYQTYARIAGNQGYAQMGPFLALNTGK